jgi:hypothetical protein
MREKIYVSSTYHLQLFPSRPFGGLKGSAGADRVSVGWPISQEEFREIILEILMNLPYWPVTG